MIVLSSTSVFTFDLACNLLKLNCLSSKLYSCICLESHHENPEKQPTSVSTVEKLC